jgi:hypothetical protein
MLIEPLVPWFMLFGETPVTAAIVVIGTARDPRRISACANASARTLILAVVVSLGTFVTLAAGRVGHTTLTGQCL